MKILITGGAGFIGTHLTKELLDTNEIIIFDNFLEQVHHNQYNRIKGVKYLEGDVCNKDKWDIALDYNPDVIFHLASETGTGQSMNEISRYIKTNVLGTSNMIDCLNSRKHNVQKIILSSSRAVYGEGENIESSKCLNPLSIYGMTKINQENILTLTSPIPYTIFRYQNVYGVGQSLHNPYTGILSIFSNKFINNEDIEIWDSGKPSRDFIYVSDVVNATIKGITNSKSDFNIYNVGTGINTTILKVGKILKNILKSNGNIKIIDYHRSGDIMHAKANILKIQNDLDWTWNVNINEGIEKLSKWVMKNE